MTVAAIHFEVKKHAVRQTADGWVISFVVHPNDMDSAFAISPLGTRYMLAVAQIGDDEQIVSPAGKSQPKQERTTEADGSGPLTPPRPVPAGELQRQRYAAMSPAEQAVTRAALLAQDERFRAWVAAQWDCPVTAGEMVSKDEAAAYIRLKCCGRQSRRSIAEVPEHMDSFLAMETEYLIDVGQIAKPR